MITLKDTFKINTKKIVLMAMMIALYIVISWISKLANLSIFPAANFLKIEFSDFIFLISVFFTGWFYLLFQILISIFLRILILGETIVDGVSLIFADGVFVLVFFFTLLLIERVFMKLIFKNTKKEESVQVTSDNKKTKNKISADIVSCIIALVVSTIITSLVMGFLNYIFIYRLYIVILGFPQEVIDDFNKLIVPFVIPFNLIKFSINAVLFIPAINFIRHTLVV